MKTYRWQQGYEMGRNQRHWSIVDTESEKTGTVSCASIVLMIHDPLWFGQPFEKEPFPRRIIAALNATSGMTIEEIESMTPNPKEPHVTRSEF